MREVWDDNLEAELQIIRSILEEYPVSGGVCFACACAHV